MDPYVWFKYIDEIKAIEHGSKSLDDVNESSTDENEKLDLLLVNLLKPSQDSAVIEAYIIQLNAFSKIEANRELICNSGVIPILIDILKKADPKIGLNTIQSITLSTLAILCRYVPTREEVRNCNGISHIIRIANVKDEQDFISNLNLLKELSKNRKNKVILREGKLIKFLVKKLSECNGIVLELILDTLAIMNLGDVKSQQITSTTRGISPIIKLVQHNNVEISKRAIRCLSSVAQSNSKIQKIVLKSKVIPIIVNMLTHKNEEIRKSAASGIAGIALHNYTNQIAIRKCNAIPLLVQLLSDENQDSTIEQACSAIHALVQMNTKIQNDFKENSAIPIIVNLLSNPNIRIQLHATSAILELARDNSKTSEIICSSGAICPLISALDSDNEVIQYLTTGAIWALARKSKKRKELFVSAKALQSLAHLNKSNNATIKQATKLAIKELS